MLCVATSVATAMVLGAPEATADPEDRYPYCSGDLSPIDDLCQPMAYQVYDNDASGANPNVPVGPNPMYEPMTGLSYGS